MTYKTARAVAFNYGAKPCRFPADAEVTGCWIDRIAYLPSAAERGEAELARAINEANRYAG